MFVFYDWPFLHMYFAKNVAYVIFHFNSWLSFQWLCSLLWGYHTHTHTRLTALSPGLPVWAGTRKVKPIWILLKQEIVSGSGISWAICKSAPCSRQITTPAPHHSVFYRPDALLAAQPTASKHWRHIYTCVINLIYRECRSWDLSSIRQSESELWWLWLTQVCRHTYHQTSDCVYRPPEYRPITARWPFAALRSSTRPSLSHAQGSYFSLILNIKLKDIFPSILWIVVNGGSW